MGKNFLVIAAIAASVGCQPNENKQKQYAVPGAEDLIKGYISAKMEFKETTDIFFADLGIENDTIILQIANQCPNSETMRFNCEKYIDGFRVLFTGKKIEGYTCGDSAKGFPPDVVKMNKDMHMLILKDYIPWIFKFSDVKLIHYFPKDEIDKFLNVKDLFP